MVAAAAKSYGDVHMLVHWGERERERDGGGSKEELCGVVSHACMLETWNDN